MKGGGAEVGTRDRSFETKPRLVPVLILLHSFFLELLLRRFPWRSSPR